jgi:hypothetical protein
MSDEQQKFLFVIGPQRSGTTWLYSYLAAQPSGIFLDRLEKENYFFSKRARENASHQRTRFLNRISGSGAPTLCADVCSTYFGHPAVIEGILAAFPEAKFAFIQRDETARRKSFASHRAFNRLSAWTIGYEISWDLYKKQADFDGFEEWLKTRVPADRLCKLYFSDLEAAGGAAWVRAIEQLMNVQLEALDLGVVNKTRKKEGLFKPISFMGVRLVQATRIHILIRHVKNLLISSDYITATKGGVV